MDAIIYESVMNQVRGRKKTNAQKTDKDTQEINAQETGSSDTVETNSTDEKSADLAEASSLLYGSRKKSFAKKQKKWSFEAALMKLFSDSSQPEVDFTAKQILGQLLEKNEELISLGWYKLSDDYKQRITWVKQQIRKVDRIADNK